MLREGFKNIVHLFDSMNDEAGKERIVAGDLVSFDELWPFLNKPFDKMKLAGERPDSHHGPDLVADGACIDVDGIAPRAVAPFTAWDLTIARYGIFGLACLLLMIDRRFRPVRIAPSRFLIGLLLGGAGYVGYFISVAFAVQLAGAAVPPVIIGTMSVFLASPIFETALYHGRI